MSDTLGPKMPEPVYSVFVRGNLQDTMPYAPAWTLKDGVHALVTHASALAYAEALAVHRVAQERERCAQHIEELVCECCHTESEVEFARYLAGGLRQQPPETGKEPRA